MATEAAGFLSRGCFTPSDAPTILGSRRAGRSCGPASSFHSYFARIGAFRMAERSSKASLLIVFLIVFIDLIGFGMVIPLLPIYADQFTVDEHGLVIGLLMAAFSAMQFLFAPLWGRVSDRIGRRPVLLIGLAGSVVFYGLFAVATVAQSLLLLFISRIGAGIAGATVSTAHAYIADVTSLQDRAKGMALIGAAFGLGFTFGPLLAVVALPDEAGVPGPGPGYAAAGLSATALVLGWFLLPETLHTGKEQKKRQWIDLGALGSALSMPSVGLLLFTSFVCVYSFGNFETTLSMTMKNNLHFDFRDVCKVFAFIGFTLMLVQGGIVRRVSGRIPEGTMAALGALLEIVGFTLLVYVTDHYSLATFLGALAVIVSGFACITPSLNALISRRSDPAQQGSVLGLAQSVSALARILGPMTGIPLFKLGASLPFWTASGLMAVGLVLVLVAARRGHDFAPAAGAH
jgi:MFS family permease